VFQARLAKAGENVRRSHSSCLRAAAPKDNLRIKLPPAATFRRGRPLCRVGRHGRAARLPPVATHGSAIPPF